MAQQKQPLENTHFNRLFS